MIELLADMPPHTIGVRASGTLTRQDYHDTLIPAVRGALEQGRLNVVFVTDPDFSGLDTGALWEDAKAAGSIGLGHLSDWGRVAVVTDKDWIRHATSAFGWLSPGEMKLFEPDELDAARAWVAAAES
jgi:hypothetical protein